MGASLKIEKKTLLKDIRRLVVIIIASFVISLNLKTFVRTGDLLPGGLSGITILIQQLFLKFFQMELPYSAINLSLNAIPAIISYKYIGKKFTIFSGVCIFLSSIFTDMLPSFQITYDILLISIFGGIIAGVSVSACLLAGATAGGTDFIAIFFAQKHGIDTFNYILCGNAIVLIIAGCIFGWDRALYSIIYQFTTTQIIHTCYKRYQRNTLLIITDKPDEVSKVISATTSHGATCFTGYGSYNKNTRSMVYSVVGSDEVKNVIMQIKVVDPSAFINTLKTDYLIGNFYKKPND